MKEVNVWVEYQDTEGKCHMGIRSSDGPTTTTLWVFPCEDHITYTIQGCILVTKAGKQVDKTTGSPASIKAYERAQILANLMAEGAEYWTGYANYSAQRGFKGSGYIAPFDYREKLINIR